jgi:hypothetical protein
MSSVQVGHKSYEMPPREGSRSVELISTAAPAKARPASIDPIAHFRLCHLASCGTY